MNMETNQGYGVGYRFEPTDYELVQYYLYSRSAMGNYFMSEFVTDYDDEFYGTKEPWEIWDECGGSKFNSGEVLYFFTDRRKVAINGKVFDRKVGSGTWSQDSSRQILSKNKDSATGKPVVVGTERKFHYESHFKSDQNDSWMMREYELNKDDVTVLCTLRKNSRKSAAPPPIQTKIKIEENSGNCSPTTPIQKKIKIEE